MKIACVQMDIAFAKPEENYQKAESFIIEAAQTGADCIILPEMWNTGYALDQLKQLADEEGMRTKDLLGRLSSTYEVNLIGGSVSTRKGSKFYNTMYGFNRDGKLIADYDKAHLFKLMDEHHHLAAGMDMNLFKLDGITCGGLICYDIRFPEWLRKHALEGAKVMFICAEWPRERIDHWEVLLKARAIENQCYVIAVNRVGDDPNNSFNGHSMVIAPWGTILVGGDTGEGIQYATIDLAEIEHVRSKIPVFDDRRASLY